MKIKKNLVLGALLALGVSAAEASGAGTTGAQFLKIEPSARPMGMGGAFSAVASDAGGIFYNPASIASLESPEFAGTYLSYFQDIRYGSLAGVIPLESAVLGAGVNYTGVTDIPRRGAVDVSDPDGTLRPESSFGAHDTAVSVAYARRNAFPSVLEGLDAGAALRVIYQKIDDETAFSVMADLGVLYPATEKVSLALSVGNIGMNVKFRDDSDPLPLNLRGGAAFRALPGLTVAADINQYIIDNILYASAGAEYWVMDVFALRAGYKYGYDTSSLGNAGLGAGFGVRVSGVGLDYAFAPFGELGDTHRITIWGRM